MLLVGLLLLGFEVNPAAGISNGDFDFSGHPGNRESVSLKDREERCLILEGLHDRLLNRASARRREAVAESLVITVGVEGAVCDETRDRHTEKSEGVVEESVLDDRLARFRDERFGGEASPGVERNVSDTGEEDQDGFNEHDMATQLCVSIRQGSRDGTEAAY